MVDEDDTCLCFLDRAIFMTNMTETEIGRLVKDKDAYVEYPRDEDMQIRVAAEKKIRQL